MRRYQPPTAGIAALLFLSAASFAATKQVTGRAVPVGASSEQHCTMDPTVRRPNRSNQDRCAKRESAERKVSGKHACQMGGAHGSAAVRQARSPKAQPNRRQSGETKSQMGFGCGR